MRNIILLLLILALALCACSSTGQGTELKSKTTGKLITLTASNDSYRPSVEEDFRLDDYECTRIKGTLYLVDLPVEAIITKPDTATQLFIVGYSDINEGTAYNCYLAGTNSRSIGGMFDFLVYG